METYEPMQFFCPMKKVPTTTHQQLQVTVVNGKPHFYEPDDVKAARALLRAAVIAHKPAQPFSQGVRLMVKWCFPLCAQHKNGEYRTTKPDTDNLQKLLKDVMTDCGFWVDDALVCSEIAEKFWAEVPGLFIRVEAVA
ncbi:MAG: RusA family crossover junction endodeoxyribonuclease [Clostridia bacterium]